MSESFPEAVNYHLFHACNLRCRFCFARFGSVRQRLATADSKRLIEELRAAGADKINFAGGEPTLHPDLGALITHAKALGLTTSVVTNGARLGALLDGYANQLDWVALSVDSGREEVQAALGRGRGSHVSRAVALARRCHASGVRVKLNTVVTALTWQEDMSALVRAVAPARWKVFQVLPIAGENDGDVEPLLISSGQFRAFVERHAPLAAEGIRVVPEDNDAMVDSYAMVDPKGRFYGNSGGRYHVSPPILQVGVAAAFAAVGFHYAKLVARGGRYDW